LKDTLVSYWKCMFHISLEEGRRKIKKITEINTLASLSHEDIPIEKKKKEKKKKRFPESFHSSKFWS